MNDKKLLKIDRYLKRNRIHTRAKGATLTICDESEVLFNQGYGDMKKDSPMIMGASSQVLTAEALLTLLNQHQISVDTSISDFIKVPQVLETVTIQELLNHTSGIHPYATIDDLAFRYNQNKELQYSNCNYNLIGLIIEKISQQSFDVYMDYNLFKPLNMNNSYANIETAHQQEAIKGYQTVLGMLKRKQIKRVSKQSWIQEASGYLVSNANDISKFMMAQLQNETFLNDLKSVEIPHGATISDDIFTKSKALYQASWIHKTIESEAIYYRIGKTPNFTTMMVLLPERKLALQLSFNLSDVLVATRLMEELMENVIKIVCDDNVTDLSRHRYTFGHALINNMIVLAFILMISPMLYTMVAKGFFNPWLLMLGTLPLISHIILKQIGIRYRMIKEYGLDIFIVLVFGYISLGIIFILQLLNYFR